jgi:NAD(P)-dependent dehydrogenase (short-subunit alcohol dehydrogenase family)
MRDLDRRGKLREAARAAGVLERIEFLALDVTNAGHVAAIAAMLAERTEPLDALVNNAGFAMAGFCEDVSDEELRQQFETNFFGAAAVTRAIVPLMRLRGKGHIVMVSSISGRIGFPGVGSYSASKFALEGWAETLRLEMKPLGIQVVLVEPGSFETDIWTRNAILAEGTKEASCLNAARMATLMERRGKSKLKANPQIVADRIAAILDNPRPRLRYVVGKDARLGVLLKGLLPSKVLEWILIRESGIDTL